MNVVEGQIERITGTGVLITDIGWLNVYKYNIVKDLDEVKVLDRVKLAVDDKDFITGVSILDRIL